jgi:hypothetical protein
MCSARRTIEDHHTRQKEDKAKLADMEVESRQNYAFAQSKVSFIMIDGCCRMGGSGFFGATCAVRAGDSAPLAKRGLCAHAAAEHRISALPRARRSARQARGYRV